MPGDPASPVSDIDAREAVVPRTLQRLQFHGRTSCTAWAWMRCRGTRLEDGKAQYETSGVIHGTLPHRVFGALWRPGLVVHQRDRVTHFMVAVCVINWRNQGFSRPLIPQFLKRLLRQPWRKSKARQLLPSAEPGCATALDNQL